MWFKGSRKPVLGAATSHGSPSPPSWTARSGEFTVCNTHLSFIPGWSALQLSRLVRSLTGTREPLVLIGDLNMEQRQAAQVSGLRPIAPAADLPGRRTRGGSWTTCSCAAALRATGPAEAVRLPLSDHRALVVPCGPS